MENAAINMQSPIGVFDSGVGGLSVLKSLLEKFPNERFIYLGDTARLPFGTKSPESITRYSLDACAYLNDLNVKSIVVACHTASTCAIPTLREVFPDLIIEGVVEASARRAVEVTCEGSVLIFGTEATVKSQRYNTAIGLLNPNLSVLSQACGLLVTLAEENWLTGEVPEKVVAHYFNLVRERHPEHKISSLVLACTHFPILFDTIRKILPETIELIDPGIQVAEQLYQRLFEKNLLKSEGKGLEPAKFLVTDNLERFKKVASYFLNQPNALFPIELVSLDKKEVSR